MRFIEFFDGAYVINLPNRTDRRQEMSRELENAGIPFTPGKVDIFPAIRPESAAPFESIGVRGAFLSHLDVLKQAKARGLKSVLILEDDLELRRDFKEYESVLLEELTSKDWDLVHFGYCRDQSPPLVNLPILQPFSGEITGAQFYAVNGKTLEKLIDFFEVLLQRPLGHPDGGPMPADGVLNVFKWQYPEIVRLIAVPSFGDQRSSKSDISPKWFDNISLLASLAGWARKIKKRISSASVR